MRVRQSTMLAAKACVGSLLMTVMSCSLAGEEIGGRVEDSCADAPTPVLLSVRLAMTICVECRDDVSGPYPLDANIFEIPANPVPCERSGEIQVHQRVRSSLLGVVHEGDFGVPYVVEGTVLRVGELLLWSKTPSGSGYGDDTDELEFQYVSPAGDASNVVSWTRTRAPEE